MAHTENKFNAIEFGQFSNIWKRMSGGIKVLGLVNKEAGAAATAMTKLSVTPEVAGTAFNRFAQNLLKVDIKSKGATNFVETIRKEGIEGLFRVVKSMAKEADKIQLEKIFGIEGYKTFKIFLSTAGQEATRKAYKENLKTAEGAIKKEFELRKKTLGFKLQQIKNVFMNMMDTIGKPLVDIAKKLIKALTPIETVFVGFIKDNKKLVAYILASVAGLGAFIVVLGSLKIAFAGVGYAVGGLIALSKGLWKFFGIIKVVLLWLFWLTKRVLIFLTIKILLNPIFWKIAGIVAIIGLVIGAMYLFYKWLEKLGVVAFIVGLFEWFINKLKIFHRFMLKHEVYGKILVGLKKAFIQLYYNIVSILEMIKNGWNNLISFFMNASDWLGSVFESAKNGIANTWDWIYNKVKSVYDAIVGFIKDPINGIGNLIGGAWDFFFGNSKDKKNSSQNKENNMLNNSLSKNALNDKKNTYISNLINLRIDKKDRLKMDSQSNIGNAILNNQGVLQQ